MPREKRDVKELKQRAIHSLVLAIELFNRPHGNGRPEGTLIFLHHAFEMLLKAIIKDKKGTVHGKGEKYSFGFDKCLEIAQNELKILSKDERSALSILDAHRDTAVHYYQDVSEDLLYLQSQSAVTLFDDILGKSFGVKLADFIPERILPVSTRPPKDIQILIDSELTQVDDLLGAGNRRGIQATARLRSIMALATASRDDAERVTEGELRRAVQRRRKGEEWKVIFPEIGQLRLDTEGEGMLFSLRIRKGMPVRSAGEGEDALIIRDRDWFDKFNLSLNDVAKKLEKTPPKTRAYMFEINIWNDPEMYGEKKIKSQRYKRYTQKALNALRAAVAQYPEDEIWEKHKDKVLGRK
ncbi:DUF3644 domain-containing protein [Desulfocurvus vexinensis]|uniref:DUF3644 domain-containing protein n=1 Tax=Desulfocurvus vexinensis TaxID=399548 RepID=UPI0012EB397F|nr:DUF3644 domain-containing protein [Desulfocurvus vexinensis]